MTASISSMPAPPGPPERYTSAGRAESDGSRASLSPTVPGRAPERSSGTRRVAHSAPVATRHERQVAAPAEPANPSTTAAVARAPRAMRVQTPAIPLASLPRPGARATDAGRSVEGDALERLVARPGGREAGAVERDRLAGERDGLRAV